ncbi:MAG: hypothetical protein KDD94_07570, partial [Calditrichaeota bacterium]|nr:hypothetical protein [Calditrichota bacterium]
IPEYNGSILTLQEKANALQLKHYSDLFPLLEPYKTATTGVIITPKLDHLTYGRHIPNYDTLKTIIKLGEAHLPAFEQFWKDSIQADEIRMIDVWKQQNQQFNIPDMLFKLARINARFDTLFVGAISLHLSGSGLVTPISVHSGYQRKPNLAWFLGHELTHMIVGDFSGVDWRQEKRFAKIVDYLNKHNINHYEVEEALCLHNQIKLSQLCGLTKSDYRISVDMSDDLLRKKILVQLEDNWDDYLNNPTKFVDELDYLKWCVERVIK